MKSKDEQLQAIRSAPDAPEHLIVERQENDAYDDYRSCNLCLAWINALAAGHPDAEIE